MCLELARQPGLQLRHGVRRPARCSRPRLDQTVAILPPAIVGPAILYWAVTAIVVAMVGGGAIA